MKSKLLKIIITLSLFLSLFLLFKSQAIAAIVNPVIGELGTNEGVEDGSKFINYAVYLWQVSINLGALAVIAFFMWGAFEWLTAGSDSKKTETARSRMTNAVVGLVIMVASFTILSFVSKVFFGDNFDLLRLTFPTRLETSGGPSGSPGGQYDYIPPVSDPRNPNLNPI